MLVIDPLWGLPAEAALRVLSPGGRLVNPGFSAGADARFSSAAVRTGCSQSSGTPTAPDEEQKAGTLADILTHVGAGRITADLETIPLAGRRRLGEVRPGLTPQGRADP
jgi:NADPH:quinone reductase-like Zn-dependent oxidoreductase